jgi:hypothetical protein
LGNADSKHHHHEQPCKEEQRHVHELVGSVKIAEREDPHNHRFATVTCEAIPYGINDHVHEVIFRTDFYDDHFHEFKGRTSCSIRVGNRHVHFIDSVTSENDGHKHLFEAATLIDNPIGIDHKMDELYRQDENYHKDDCGKK